MRIAADKGLTTPALNQRGSARGWELRREGVSHYVRLRVLATGKEDRAPGPFFFPVASAGGRRYTGGESRGHGVHCGAMWTHYTFCRARSALKMFHSPSVVSGREQNPTARRRTQVSHSLTLA